MRYLILGGAGFLGTWTTNRLVENIEDSVVVFDREYADYGRLSQKNHNLEIRKGNFSSYDNFEELVEGCDIVFHFISSTNPSMTHKNICTDIEENILSTIRLLDSCVKQNIKKIVFISSGGTVYGRQANQSPIKETDPTNPISPYGIQKLTIEKYIQLYNYMYKLDYRIIRLSNPFGPYQNPFGNQGVLSSFVYRIVNNLPIIIFGDGSIVRDFIYVADAIDMILNIVNKENSDKLYNVGSGVGYSITDGLRIIEYCANKKSIVSYAERRLVDVPINILDISKYLSEVSSTRPNDIRVGITKLIDFYSDKK